MISSRAAIKKEPRDIGKKNPGKTYLPRFLDESDTESLKSSVERELADISMYMEQERQITSKIIPGSTFQGTWDACEHKYPKAEENSTWDVIVTCGTSTEFDGKTWAAGQQLIYLQTSGVFVQRTNPSIEGMKNEIETLKVEVDGSKALIETNRTAIADTNFALGTLTTEINAKVDANTASIKKTDEAVVDLTQSVATSFSEVRADYNGKFAGVNQSMSAIVNDVGVLNAKWTVETDVNGKISGLEMVNNGLKSEFNILTDKFSVSDGTTNNKPFTIEGSTTAMNDVIVRGHIEAKSGSFKGDLTGSNGTFTGTLTGGHVVGGDLNIGGGKAVITEAGKATFTDSDIQGAIRATSGEFNNVTIHESCTFLGTVNADKIKGDIVDILPEYNKNLGFSVRAGSNHDTPLFKIKRDTLTKKVFCMGEAGNFLSTTNNNFIHPSILLDGVVVYDNFPPRDPSPDVLGSKNFSVTIPAGTGESVITQRFYNSHNTDSNAVLKAIGTIFMFQETNAIVAM